MTLLTGDVKIRAPPGSEKELIICTSEILRNKLYRSYLDSFRTFCQGLGGATAEVMGSFLNFEADRRVISICCNSVGSELGRDDRLGLLQKLDWKIQVKSVERQGLATLIKGGGPPKPKVASVDLEKAVKNEEEVYFMYLCRKPDLPTPGAPD